MTARAPAAPPVDLRAFAREAGACFNTQALTAAESPIPDACARLLIVMQAVAVLIVVAGMIGKLRRDHEQMEGIASLLLKVAFIATIPLWQTKVLESSDAIAEAIGTPTVTAEGAASPLTSKLWALAGQWMPAQSPYLDALDAQNSANLPASGGEQDWALRSWNWARGITATTTDTFGILWQGITGGLRATLVHLGCAAMACISLLTVILVYVASLARALIFLFGCAMLPVFIAGLGVEALRATSVKFILGLFSVACWPVAWAMANLLTDVLSSATATWMTEATATALNLPPSSANLPAIAEAAPFFAWGVLCLFIALTLATCAWIWGSLLAAPWLVGRAVNTGAHALIAAVVAPSSAAFLHPRSAAQIFPEIRPTAPHLRATNSRPEGAMAARPAAIAKTWVATAPSRQSAPVSNAPSGAATALPTSSVPRMAYERRATARALEWLPRTKTPTDSN